MPKISIIIPVYNAEKYLDSCIESVVCQSFPDWELLLVNDGSRDSSQSICEQWARKDSRILLLNKENGGIISALTCGLSHAQGEYVTFMDNDDWFEKEFLSVLYHSAAAHGADIVQCNHRQTGPNFLLEPKYPAAVLDREYISARILPNYAVGKYAELSPFRWDKLYRRSVLSSISQLIPADKVVGEDVLMNFIAATQAQKIVIEDTEPLYNWRYNPASASRAYSAKVRMQEPSYWQSLEKIAATVGLQYLCKTQESIETGYVKYIYACGISNWTYAQKKKEIKEILSLIRSPETIRQRIRTLPPSSGSEKIFLTLVSCRAIWLALLLVYAVKKLKKLD